MLATHSLLPIVNAFASKAGVEVETKDISLASRVLSIFPEYLKEEQRVNDALAELGGLVKNPENLKKTLLGLAVMAVLLIISYILGDSQPVLDAQGNVHGPKGPGVGYEAVWAESGVPKGLEKYVK